MGWSYCKNFLSVGRISDLTKYPIDSSLSGLETMISTDPDNSNATRNITVNSISDFVFSLLKGLKNPTSTLYSGFIVIGREGVGKDNTIVQQDDILIGRSSSFFSGEFVFLTANQDNPTLDEHFTVKLNLG